MPRAFKYPRTDFSAGLLNPTAEGKISNAILEASLRQADNCRLDKNGNVTSAPGTEFKADLNALTEKDGPFAKVEFKVSNDLMYCLVFGNYTMYVKKNGEYLRNQDQTLYTVKSEYKAEDLFDSNGICNFKFAQGADVLYIAHKDYPLKILKRKGDLDWSFSSLKGGKGPWGEVNDDKTKYIASDGAANDVVTLYSDKGTQPFADFGEISCNWDIMALHRRIKIWINGVQEIDTGLIYGKTYPYFPRNMEIAQLLNSIPGIVATTPTENSLHIVDITSARDLQEIHIYLEFWDQADFENHWDFFTNFSQGEDGVELFDQSWVGRYIRIFQPPIAFVPMWRSGKNVNLNDYILYGNNYYKANNGGTIGELPPTHTEGLRSDGAISWEYINSGYAVGQVVEFVSPNEIKIKVTDGNMPVSLNSSTGSYLWQLDLDDKKPQGVEFFKDRLFLAYNNRLTASNTGDYENFDDIEYGEQLPTSAINFILQLPLNKICWLKALNDVLYLGTEANIIAVKALNAGDVLGPNNISYEIISYTGACKITPVVLDSILMFLATGRNKIISIQYNFQTNSYIPHEMTAYNDFFLTDTIVSWALSYTPDKNILAVTGAGEVLDLRLLSADIISLVKHKTDKRFKQVISLFDPALNKDKAGFISFAGGKWLDEEAGQNPLEMSVKAQLEFNESGKAVSVCAPEVLQGRELFLIAAGKAYGPLKPGESGSIDLSGFNIAAGQQDYKAYLGFFSPALIEFMPVTGGGQSPQIATSAGQRIVSVTARVWQSKRFKFGCDLKELWPAAALEEDTAKNGDIVLDVSSSTTYPAASRSGAVNSTGARFFILQDRPLDFCLCGLFYDISISEG